MGPKRSRGRPPLPREKKESRHLEHVRFQQLVADELKAMKEQGSLPRDHKAEAERRAFERLRKGWQELEAKGMVAPKDFRKAQSAGALKRDRERRSDDHGGTLWEIE